MPRVTFSPSGVVVDVAVGTSLFRAAEDAAMTTVSCCGITASCGRCRVTVLDGEDALTAPDARELAGIKRLAFLPGDRFGCMAHVQGDVEVEIVR